jgi:hypothetical protein
LALIAEENPIMREILRSEGVITIGRVENFHEALVQCTGLELYAVLRHAHILFMNWCGTPRPFLIPFENEKAKIQHERMPDELSMPPLIVFQDGDFMFGWPEHFALYLIGYNLLHYPLRDIMLRQEPRLYLPNSPLISEEKRKYHWSYLREEFSYIF